MVDYGIRGELALVIGGTRGLGLSCATALAEAGARVIVNGRDAAVGEAVAKRLGNGAVYIQADIAKAGERADAVQGGGGARAGVDPGDQCRRAAARPVPRCDAGRLALCLRDERLRRRRDGALLPARHDRAKVRPHRQHHFVRGEGALSEHGAVQHRPHRADRGGGVAGARGDRARRHGEQHPSRPDGHGRPAARVQGPLAPPGDLRRRRSRRRWPRRSRPSASARRRISARSAPSCVRA